jgi:hypothetical protein
MQTPAATAKTHLEIIRVLLGQSLVNKLQGLFEITGFDGVPDRRILAISNQLVRHLVQASPFGIGTVQRSCGLSKGLKSGYC